MPNFKSVTGSACSLSSGYGPVGGRSETYYAFDLLGYICEFRRFFVRAVAQQLGYLLELGMGHLVS